MITVECPGCGLSYSLDDDFKEGQKLFCEQCDRKYMYLHGQMVAISPEVPQPADAVRQSACPYCNTVFSWENDVPGEYSCPSCEKTFYLPVREEFAAPEELPATDAEVTESASQDAAVDAEVTESAPQDAAAPAANAPLLQFANGPRTDVAPVKLDPKIKIGLPRARSGISGVFINIAEKLCGN